MEMNRHNYETFFLLYADNELNAEERKAVDDFVALHADLKAELQGLLQTRLPIDEPVSFSDKNILYRTAPSPSVININNYEEWMVQYVDGELNDAEIKAVDDFIQQHPHMRSNLALLQRVKLLPAEDIVFENKAALYRTQKPVVRMRVMPWQRMVAAASIIAIGSWIWMNAGKMGSVKVEDQQGVAQENRDPQQPVGAENKNTQQQAAPVSEKDFNAGLAAVTKEESNTDRAIALNKAVVTKNSSPVEKNLEDNQITYVESRKITRADEPAPAALRTLAMKDAPVTIQPERKIQHTIPVAELVQPVILDQTAFNSENDAMPYEAVSRNDEGVAYLDTDNAERKSKTKFRGLLRKASRFVDHVTNPDLDINDKQSVVRIASFEITRK